MSVKEDAARIEALAKTAKERCEGCRLAWRYSRDWVHREPMPVECNATAERIERREIVAAQI